MKKIFLLLILLFPITCYADSLLTVELSSCIDGDTAQFVINGENRKVRFLGINSPELSNNGKPAEEYAVEASVYTCNVLKSANKIQLEYDPSSDKMDKYERDLAWVFIDGELLEKKIVEKGYASVEYIYDDNYLHVDDLCNAESKAQKSKLGIWKSGKTEGYCKGGSYTRKKTNEMVNNSIKKLLKSPLILYIFFSVLILYIIGKFRKRRWF